MSAMVRILLMLTAVLGFAGAAAAQSFPAKPVRVVIPYSAGGGTDNLLRIIAPEVSNSLGQQLILENRPGAASALGTEMVVNAAPDGYTILASDSALLINPGLFKNLPFDTEKGLTGVTMLATAPVLLVVHPSVKANTLQELLALAKATPGGLNYASGGNGASTHLAGELMKLVTGVDIVHVPYKGSAPATTAVLSGEVHMQFTGISSSKAYLDAGKLRPIALTGARRNPATPEIPTFEESGVKGVDANTYWGIYAPAATPPAVLKILNEHFVRTMRKPELADRLAALGYDPVANTPQEHTEQMRRMIAQWTDVVQRAKVQVD